MAKKTPGKKPPTKTDDTEDPEEGQEGSQDGEDGEDGNDAEEQNRRINAIVTSRVKREMKGVLSTLAQIQDSLKGLSAPKKTEDEEDEDGEPAADQKAKTQVEDTKLARKMERMAKELADQKAETIKAQKERAEEQERARRSEMINAYDQALAEHGVSDPKLRKAALHVLEAEGFMLRDEDGKVKFKGQDKYGIETLYDPKIGLKSWVTGEGKSFVPAVEASGSGTGPARNSGQSQNLSKGEFGKLSPQQKAAIELERASSGLPPLE